MPRGVDLPQSRPSLARRVLTCFAEERFFWPFAAAVLGVVSFGRGIRRPSTWAATQALLNYDRGLVKRGLFGASLGHWFHTERYASFAMVSYVLLAVFAVLLILFTLRSGALHKAALGVTVAIFFSSFAVTYLAHLVGYFDILLGAMTVALLLIANPWLRVVAALPVCLCGVLIHEMFLIAFLPVIVFSFVLDGAHAPGVRQRHLLWAGGAVLLCVCAAAGVWMGGRASVTAAEASQLQAELAAKADFTLRPDFFAVLQRSAIQNFNTTRDFYGLREFHRYEFFLPLAIFAPILLMLLRPVVIGVRLLFEGSSRRWGMTCALVAALSPLLLHVFGWDNARWDALTCLTTFLVLLLLCRSLPETGIPLTPAYRNAAILAIALSMATGETLLDWQQVNAFPFTRSVRRLLNTPGDGIWSPPKEVPASEIPRWLTPK